MNKLTALVITFNEVNNIDGLIESVQFADHIIIIDSFSTDGTVEKINQYPQVKLIQKEFNNFSDQRNFALNFVETEWVLFIDADERVTTSLKKEILDKINSKTNDIVAYEIYRKFYFKKQLVRFSGWQTDKVFRLYKKTHVSYKKDLLVHELLDITGKTSILKHKLLHYSFDSYIEYKTKMEQYARLRAKELYLKKLKPNAFHFIIKPFYRFINHYLIRLGFLDGKKGIILSYLNSYYVFRRYVELKKLYQENT